MGESKAQCCRCMSLNICQGNGKICRLQCASECRRELNITLVLFPFLGNSWENLNMSIITEDWLLGSTEIFPFFPSSLFFSSPLSMCHFAVLPTLALEEVRGSHSGPDAYTWQLQLPGSASVMVEERSCSLLF